MSVPLLIAQARRSQGLTQAALARRSGIPRSAVNAYERGHRHPSSATLARLVEACGMRLVLAPAQTLDLDANARDLEQVLDLAEHLPRRRSGELEFPPLPQ